MSVAVAYTAFEHEQSEALKKQLVFAKRILKDALDIEVESLEPIARGYNNKVYLLKTLPSNRASDATSRPLQPGCLPFPATTPDALIFRTVRNNSQTPAARKVLNSVAAMQLVRESTDIPIAPLYAYDVSAEDAWMVEGKLPGVPMDEAWHTADTDTRLRMLESLAEVFAKLKAMPNPGGPGSRFGGLGYDAEGKIVLGPTCLAYDEGPFATAKDHYKAWIGGQWEDAKRNARADGWKVDGLHERIEKFVREGLDSALHCLDGCDPVFIHADFGLMNTLVSETDPHVITGLLDFEWSHFGPQSDEYFLSSPGPGMIYGGPHVQKPDSPTGKTMFNLLCGTIPANLDPSLGDAFLTYKMDGFLKARNVGTFSTIPNFKDIARLYWFGEYMRPWFFHENVKLPEEKMQKTKAKSAICFDKDLQFWGY
ncbi:kinase-like domain-containing protein [Mycena galericulata]|nr:kinase-like domain-containing protein [Mycena galericulata]